MVIKNLPSDDNVPSGQPTIWDRLRANSTTPSPSPPTFTPSTSIFAFGEQRDASPSFSFEDRATSDRKSPASHPTNSVTPRITSSPRPSRSNSDRTSSPSPSSDLDPDRPLLSIERDDSSTEREDSSTDSCRSTPSTNLYTPSASTNLSSARQTSEQDADIQQISELGNLRLASHQAAVSEKSRRTPSIHVTPSAQIHVSNRPQIDRTDSLVDGVEALRVDSLRAETPRASNSRESHSPSPSPSPSPAGRRRSGSRPPEDPHKIENEEPPETLAQMSEVQSALVTAKALVTRMSNVLSSSSMHVETGSSIANLWRQALKLRDFQLPSSRIVGLVGDSGVGKSSLINSLLDRNDLARASGSGAACTCAVTEYVFHERNDFVIDVDYFSIDELKEQFEDLLEAYRDYQSLLANSGNSRKKGADNDEKERLKETSKLAKETFRASFGEMLSREPAILSSMPKEKAIAKMLAWASQLLPQQMAQESFHTLKACAERLGELTSESEDSSTPRQPRTCWPFIRKLRVHLNAYILSKGLIIADLPGLRDLNTARKAITERYVRQCHHIFVVARIDRAVTDASIKEIFGLARRANLSKIDVICTRSEDIQTAEARRDWPAERETLDEMQSNIDAIKEEIRDLDEQIQDFDGDFMDLNREEATELMKLQNDRRKAGTSRNQLEFDQKRHIMTLRNNKVSNGIKDYYQTHPMAENLRIFCVSNILYCKKRNESARVALPCLQLSGILEVRRYCIGIVAQSRLRATREFIKDDIPAFLGSVDLWVEAGHGNASAERKQQTLDTVLAIQRELNKLTSPVSPTKTLSRTMVDTFSSQIHLRLGEHRLVMPARQAGNGHRCWHHSTYKAFCSHYGDYYTKTAGRHCWTDEAIQSMREDMTVAWQSLRVDLQALQDQVSATVRHTFGAMLRLAMSAEIDDRSATNKSGLHTLATIIGHREDLSLYGLAEADEYFASELSSFHTDAFSGIRTAFVAKLTEDAYRATYSEYGSGSHQRRIDHITGRFSSESLFSDHQRACRRKFREIALALQEKVLNTLNEQVELIEASLRMLQDENVVLESERDPQFRGRIDAEVQSVTVAVKRIASAVEKIERAVNDGT